MENILQINGKDAWATWGAFLVEEKPNGNYNYSELLRPAEAKPLVEVSFAEQNGVKLPDTIHIALSARDVTLRFALVGKNKAEFMARYSAFIAMLRTGNKGWLEIKLLDLNKTFRMHYLSCTEWQQLTALQDGNVVATFSVKLREPNPTY